LATKKEYIDLTKNHIWIQYVCIWNSYPTITKTVSLAMYTKKTKLFWKHTHTTLKLENHGSWFRWTGWQFILTHNTFKHEHHWHCLFIILHALIMFMASTYNWLFYFSTMDRIVASFPFLTNIMGNIISLHVKIYVWKVTSVIWY
jgi:hypothetical protein